MNWSEQLAHNVTTAEELQKVMHLTQAETQQTAAILARYPMSITQYYLSLVDTQNPRDPIGKMCLPTSTETVISGSLDTSGEGHNTVLQGLQHKYQQTALLLSTNKCAMYCRHCFRKRLVGMDNGEVINNLPQVVEYIQNHQEITNVLISGGDAFLNSNATIEQYLALLTPIKHLDLIRFGTRTPVVLPARIYEDKQLLEILAAYNRKKQLYVMTQFCHPKEITPQAIEAVTALRQRGLIVKNQAVLLQGVNDTAEVMAQLLRQLTAHGIDPYYVFQCRPVTGVKNQFQVPLRQGFAIMEAAKAQMNGLGKAFNYVMSHETGKIEILGIENEQKMFFKYHEAKNPADYGKIFTQEVSQQQAWL